VEVSIQVLEWQEQAALKTKKDVVLRVLRKRLDSPIPADLEGTIRAGSNPKQLDRWLDAAAGSSTLAEFRRLAGMEGKRHGRRGRSSANGP
jgi:hypothetical protein